MTRLPANENAEFVGCSKVSIHSGKLNEWNKLSADCMHSSNVSIKNIMFKNRIHMIHLDSYMRTLDKTTASLSAAI